MIKEIKIDGFNLSVVIKSVRRSKSIKILVYSNGRVVLTKPSFVSLKKAAQFLDSRTEFIKTSLNNFSLTMPLKLDENKQKEAEHYKKYRKQAKEIIVERVAEINKFYGFKYGRISIRNQRTRWGSCSRQGNLNFSYRLIFLEQDAFDYVIAHELCHLQEFNHSAKFWQLVEKYSPNYKFLRQQIKKDSTLVVI